MSERNYKEMMAVQCTALDNIDFVPYLEKLDGREIYELMEAVRADYNNKELTDNDVLKGEIFNFINDVELAEYLENRYKGKFSWHECSYYLFSYDN